MTSESLETLIAKASSYAQNPVMRPCAGWQCATMVAAPATVCERCALAKRSARLVAESLATVPESYRWASFAAPELKARVQNPLAVTQARAKRHQTSILFVGAAGAGKTSLAVATLRDRVEATPGERALFAPAWRLGIARARSEDSDPHLVKSAAACDLLVLDDLGSERAVASNPVPDILFERHAEGRATWITTWMSPKEVADRYGDGIARRVYERTVPIDCGGARS